MKKYNVIVVFEKDLNRTLMCKRTKEPYKGMFNLVGGKIDKENEQIKEMIRAEFKDNGGGSDSFRKGTGLTAIEERTVLTDGKCIFLIQPDRFSVVNIFNIREENK